jgi:rhodanese-related sulfurtransferase
VLNQFNIFQMRHFVLSAMFALGLISCSNGQVKTADAGEHHVIAAEEFTKRPEGAQLVDVRTPGEWSGGIIKGALLYDISAADFEKKIDALDKKKPVYVYCAVGGRSGTASELMKSKGFKVYDLKGGMGAWSSKGMPTVKP